MSAGRLGNVKGFLIRMTPAPLEIIPANCMRLIRNGLALGADLRLEASLA